MAWGISGTGRLTEPYYRLKHGHDSAPSPRYREKNAAGTVSDITSSDWDTAPTNGTLVEEWTGNQTASAPSWASDMWSGSTSQINGHSITARRYVIATSSTTTDDVEALISNTSDFNQFIWHGEHSGSGTVQYSLTLDGKQYGSVYASTFQEDNNSAVDQDGQNGINISPTAPAVAEHTFMVGYACNTGDEKLCIADHNFSTGTGAGSIPSKASVVGKTTDTSTIDNISVVNLTSGSDFTNSSKLNVFGSDLTLNATEVDFTNTQLGSRFEETNTRKIYDLHDSGTNVLYEGATGHGTTSGHGTILSPTGFTENLLWQRDSNNTGTTHPHWHVNVDTPNKAYSSSDPWIIELTFKESYTIPSGSTITYDSYNNGQGARLKYLDFQVYTGSTWENITGTITNPNHSDGDVETTSGRWVKYMTSTTTTEKTGTKFRIRMWDSWDNYVANGRHYIGGIELKIPIGINLAWQEIGA